MLWIVELDAAVKRTASSLAHSAIHFLPSLGIEMLRLSLVDFMEASCLAAIRYEDEVEDGYDDDMSDSRSASDVEVVSRLTPAHFKAIFGSCFFLSNSRL